MYLCVRELAAQLLKFPIFVTCFTQFHAFIQSISMLAYFHSAVVLVWPQIVLFMYPKGELSLSSNNHVLIQFSCSCLMTSFALILPSVINSNTTSCEMYTQSRSIGKLGFLLLVWTINSRQLELNLPGVLVYVATIPTLICSAMWMICAFILLFSMQTFSLCLKSILVYLLKGVVVPNLLILSCSFYLLVSINIFPSNLAAYLMLSVYISCIVTLILWDTNDHRIAGLLHCPSTDYHAATMKYTTNNRNSDFSLPFYKSNKPMSYSANKPEPGQSAVPDIYCHLFVRLIVLCCGLVCSFGLPIYLTYPMRVPIETVCQLYSLVSLQIFCIAQISVGYPQRWLCDKIQCRSVRLFNNGSNGVLYLILVCLVNFCVILAVILRLQFCPSFTTDIEKIIQLLVSVVGIGISLRLMFYLIEQINPTLKEKRECRKRAEAIFKNIGLKKTPCLNDYEACLDSVINEIEECVLQPLKIKHSLPVNSRLLRPPKGILLYGPPGCGKTLLARAMARAAHANFINLQIATLVNMWYGETQKYVEATFSLAEKIQPTIIFIDELDSFLTTRSQMDNEATRMIKTQFMALWDGLLTQDNTQIIIVGATNRPGDLDQAILRRLPYKIKVPLPNTNQRNHILKVLLKDDQVAKALSEDDLKQIADKTEGLSGNDLSELCREAAFICLRSLRTGDVQTDLMLTVDHFTQALQKYMNHRIKPEPVDSSISHCPCDEQTASDKKWSRRRNTGKCLL
ncbi:unnamed protein product [Heterobilharzia americana]|nr:unnamed protein product [Heterobilharzia americana]